MTSKGNTYDNERRSGIGIRSVPARQGGREAIFGQTGLAEAIRRGQADRCCYTRSQVTTLVFMSAIPARDLRNHTAEVLRRVESGEEIEVLRDNRPVAKIIPLSRRRQWLPAPEIGHELARLGPDTTGLAEELRAVLAETTDDLPW